MTHTGLATRETRKVLLSVAVDELRTLHVCSGANTAHLDMAPRESWPTWQFRTYLAHTHHTAQALVCTHPPWH